jgi:glycyl-tRNA synthetase beta chain
MKANQKYFPLLDAGGKLTNKFLVVSNIQPDDASAVIQGNERVVRPRLADAKFFFDQDRKRSLESRLPGLAKVVYHNKLGTQGERMQRVAAIARAIAARLGDPALQHQAEQAAMLAKADLLTDMVGEFPELQGIMGRYYAQHDGLAQDVADAIEDHYKPRFAGDTLPRGKVGTVVALADKLETLAGMFGIGQIPTGDKDPFALRRHALGMIRMLAEGDLALPLHELLLSAAGAFSSLGNELHLSCYANLNLGHIQDSGTSIGKLADFIYERLAGSLREQGYTPQEVDAVVSQRPERLGDIPKRLAAVRAFSALPEADALAAANKRIGNILKKAEGDMPEPDKALLLEPAEKALFERIVALAPVVKSHVANKDYADALSALASVRTEVDHFFDKVMVNVEDTSLRANRLGLLKALFDQLNAVADISKLGV